MQEFPFWVFLWNWFWIHLIYIFLFGIYWSFYGTERRLSVPDNLNLKTYTRAHKNSIIDGLLPNFSNYKGFAWNGLLSTDPHAVKSMEFSPKFAKINTRNLTLGNELYFFDFQAFPSQIIQKFSMSFLPMFFAGNRRISTIIRVYLKRPLRRWPTRSWIDGIFPEIHGNKHTKFNSW